MRERFAPSPSGLLHLGHAFSALTAWDRAQERGSDFILRIEDIDQERCKLSYEEQIFEDLRWLGMDWPKPVIRQSNRQSAYDSALKALTKNGLCYPCGCTRGDIKNAISAPQEQTPPVGPDGVVYPGTCQNRSMGSAAPGDSIRLNMKKAVKYLDNLGQFSKLSFKETGCDGPRIYNLDAEHLIDFTGDIILARKTIGTSYHLSVVVDDAFQNVTHVTRGQDVFSATFIHVLLQALLRLPTPIYHHHRLIRDEAGQRLAKRDDARALRKYRADGLTPKDIRLLVGL